MWPILTIFLLILFWPSLALALLPQLDYPEFLGLDLDRLMQEQDITLNKLGLYIYYAFVILGGVIAFLTLVLGGLKWVFYGGTIPATETSPPKMSEAKQQVIASFLGLALLTGSWFIVRAISPQLIELPPIFERKIEIEQPEPLPIKEFTDGLLFKTNHPELPFLPIPRAVLKVEDTKNFYFKPAQKFLDLSGTGNPKYYIETVTFRNPPDLATCKKDPNTNKIDLSTCKPSTYYGLICFSKPNFQGEVKVCASSTGDDTCKTTIGANTYCRSIITFKQPVKSIYAIGDRIIFYGQKSPVPKFEYEGRILSRECLKIGESITPEKCKITCTGLLSGSGGIYSIRSQGQDWDCELKRGINGIIGITNVELVEVDEKNGQEVIIRYKYPLSMEAISDRAKKYIILLFASPNDFKPGDGDPIGPIKDRSYLLIDEKIQNFLDPSDPRMFWLKEGFGDETRNKPKSVLILPVELVY